MRIRKISFQIRIFTLLIVLLMSQTTALSFVPGGQVVTSISFSKHILDASFGGALYALSIYATDIDNDGDNDIVGGADQRVGLAWWENDGGGGFSKHPLGSGAHDVYAVDLEHDGDVDILAANAHDDLISIYQNDGNQNFTVHKNFNYYGAWSVYAVDVNGDTLMDVLGTSHGGGVYGAGRVTWWENNGLGGFISHQLTGSDAGRDQNDVYGTDLDQDGDVDILNAVGYWTDEIQWWENDGSERFTMHTVTSLSGANSVYATDVDGDEDNDVLGAGSNAYWCQNNGQTNFTCQQFDSGRTVYAADIENDGDTDILNGAAWYENDGNENFTKHFLEGYSDKAASVDAVDLDGDHDLDIVVADLDDGIAWWESNASEFWPDLKLESVDWSPAEPEVMEATSIQVVVKNLGPDFIPSSDVFYLDLTVKANSDKRWFWRFPGELAPMLANDTETYTIDRFWFTRDEIDTVKACLSFEGGEANPANNCLEQSITVHPNSSHSWHECLGVSVDALVFFIDAETAGSLDAFEEAGVIFLARAPLIYSACDGADPWDYHCVKEWIRLGIDAGVTAVKGLSPHKVVITLIKDGILLLWSAHDCSANLTQHYIRASVEESRHRNTPVNAVVTHSPVYIRAIDNQGRQAGFLDDGSPVLEIPDAEVAERDGSKIVLYPGTDTASVELSGADNGTFDLILSISVPNPEVHTVAYKNVSVTTNSMGKIDVTSGQYTLALDDNGDGTIDRNIQPTEEIHTSIYYWVYLPVIMKSY